MTTYHVVLAIHLLGLLIATGAAAVMHVSHLAMRRATTVSEAGRWGMTMKHAAHGFPPAIVLLLGSGAYMVHDLWSWSDPWVLAAIAGLATIVVVGDVVNGRLGKKMGEAIGRTLATSGDGPVPEEVRRILESRLALTAGFGPTILMLGVVYVMTVKPGAAGSTIAMLIAVAAAFAVGPVLTRKQELAPARIGA